MSGTNRFFFIISTEYLFKWNFVSFILKCQFGLQYFRESYSYLLRTSNPISNNNLIYFKTSKSSNTFAQNTCLKYCSSCKNTFFRSHLPQGLINLGFNVYSTRTKHISCTKGKYFNILYIKYCHCKLFGQLFFCLLIFFINLVCSLFYFRCYEHIV